VCVKDGNVTENAGIVAAAKEYQTQAEAVIGNTIDSCVNGELTPNEAQIELAKEFAADRNNFQEAMQSLEDQLGTGKDVVAVDVRMVPEGRVNVVIYNDETVKAFECRPNGDVIPVMPNPAFGPVVVGSRVMFQDNTGTLHRNAEGAVAANQGLEQSGIFTVTGGNCPQDARLAPDFVPDPSRR